MLTELFIAVSLFAAPAAGPATATPAHEHDASEADLESPIELHHVDAFVETADGLHMQIDYHIAIGHVTIAARMDQNGTGVAQLTLNQRVLAEQEFVDGEVATESTAFGALTAEEASLLAASVYQVWDHDEVIKVMAETRGLPCGIAAGLSFLAISAGVIAGCELATSGFGTAACVTLGGGLGKETGAIVHDKCQKAQN